MKRLKQTVKAFALVGEVSQIGRTRGFKDVAFFWEAPEDIEKARSDAWLRPNPRLVEVEIPLVWSVAEEVTMHSAFALHGHKYFAVDIDREANPSWPALEASRWIHDQRDMDKLVCPFALTDFE
jgi:hypothetical protein